jgi:polyferredoxin
MGIDIRDGDQLECINCALCIDACDSIMTKVGRPHGLIAYDTLKNIARRERGEKPQYRFVRARTAIYALAIAGVSAIMLFALTHKSTIDLAVQRDRNQTFVRLSDGSVRNGYTVRFENRATGPANLSLVLETAAPLEVRVVGLPAGALAFTLKSGEERTLRLYATLKPGITQEAAIPLAFAMTNAGSGDRRMTKTVFLNGGAP